MVVFEKESVIHVHHNYQWIWTPELGEYLVCQREPTNVNNRYAVALVKDNIIVGHLPRAQLKIYSWSCSETALLIVLL